MPLTPALVRSDDDGQETHYFRASELVSFTQRQRRMWECVLTRKFSLYGGARGGGKSYFIRWAMVLLLLHWYGTEGLTNVRVGIFCETFKAVRGRQLVKAQVEFPSWLGTWNKSDWEFRLAEEFGGGVICFRNLDDPDKYRSEEFAAMAVDELTLNAIETFNELRGSLRWPGIEHCPFFAGSNPTGQGHSWCKDIWVDATFSLDETRNLVEPDPETGEVAYRREDFAYVRALPSDNPHLTKEYLRQLKALPDRMRKAFLYGSWDVFEGMAFEEWDRDVHVIPNRLPPKHWTYVAGLDWGYRKGWYGLFALSPEGDYELVWECVLSKWTAERAAKEVAHRSRHFPLPSIIYADDQMWQQTGTADTLATEWMVGMAKYYGSLAAAPTLVQATKGKGSRALKKTMMHDALAFQRDKKTGEVHPWQRPKFRVQERCRYLIRTLPALAVDPDQPEDDVNSEGDDHGYDGACNVLMARPPRPDKADEPQDADQHPGVDPLRKRRKKARWEQEDDDIPAHGRVRTPHLSGIGRHGNERVEIE